MIAIFDGKPFFFFFFSCSFKQKKNLSTVCIKYQMGQRPVKSCHSALTSTSLLWRTYLWEIFKIWKEPSPALKRVWTVTLYSGLLHYISDGHCILASWIKELRLLVKSKNTHLLNLCFVEHSSSNSSLCPFLWRKNVFNKAETTRDKLNIATR